MTRPSETSRRTLHGPRHPIRDPAALAQIVKELLDASAAVGMGSVDEMARRTTINRSTWYRLLSGSHRAIAHRVAAHLVGLIRAHLGKAGVDRFVRATTYPGAVSAARVYRQWARERRTRLRRRPGTLWERPRDSTPRPIIGRLARLKARSQYASELEAIIAAEVPAYREFQRWMQRRYFDEDRIVVAKMRILEPFLEAPESGFIEKSWHELPALERRECVRSAIRWEKWLLQQRGHHVTRAEQLGAASGLTTQ